MSKTWRNSYTKTLVKTVLSEANEIIMFDTETTGLKPDRDYIIELAAIKFSINCGITNEIERLHIYLKPPFAISEAITEITGITNEFLADKPTFEEAFSQIYKFFGSNPIIGAYNTPFDSAFMASSYKRFAPNGEEFIPKAEIDVLEMARDRVNKEDTPNYKLGTISGLFGINAKFHSAIEDITATKKLFDIFASEYSKETSASNNRIQPLINSVAFWEGYKGFNRIYVSTSSGTVFYDIRSKTWGGKDVDLDKIDMLFVENKAWELTRSTCQKEFEKFKGRITA